MGLISFLQHHMLPCPSKALLHIECPGCGMQRSLICLLQGDVTKSWHYHPATIPMLLLIGFLPFHLKYKFSKGGNIIVFLQLVVAILTVAFYIYKVYNHKIF